LVIVGVDVANLEKSFNWSRKLLKQNLALAKVFLVIIFLLLVSCQILAKHLQPIPLQVCSQSLLELVFVYSDLVLVLLYESLLVLVVQSKKLFLVVVIKLIDVDER
jgi:hypothetical protein